MSVEYSKRALDDLDSIWTYYAEVADPGAAERLEARLQEVIGRLEKSPASAQPVTDRPAVRVASWEWIVSGSFMSGILPGARGVAHVSTAAACLRGRKGPF